MVDPTKVDLKTTTWHEHSENTKINLQLYNRSTKTFMFPCICQVLDSRIEQSLLINI